MISVCIAAYNGERYIKVQLESILKQLDVNDEIIIVDDCSADRTTDIIREFNDKRIVLIENKPNAGVVKSFEKAITNAKGDIIFLSDQDDVWQDTKVSMFKQVFNDDTSITLVMSNAEIVDGSGTSTKTYFFKEKPTASFVQNLIHNNFLGCSIAFRKDAVRRIFPFPENLPMHDWWIGLNHLLYGKVYFITEPLLFYRRHGLNVTTGKRSALPTVIKWRYIMVKSLLKKALTR